MGSSSFRRISIVLRNNASESAAAVYKYLYSMCRKVTNARCVMRVINEAIPAGTIGFDL